MSVTKPTRLAKAASYFNVAREEIFQYLKDKGFTIADNPNAKIEDDMFAVLNEKYSSEHDLKEESAQFLTAHSKTKEEKIVSKAPVDEIKEEAKPEIKAKKEIVKPETDDLEK
ncbi:MAG: hypothetical protein ACK43K_11760 [Chitinophagales bacterium]